MKKTALILALFAAPSGLFALHAGGSAGGPPRAASAEAIEAAVSHAHAEAVAAGGKPGRLR